MIPLSVFTPATCVLIGVLEAKQQLDMADFVVFYWIWKEPGGEVEDP
jgi:hypothetical protein